VWVLPNPVRIVARNSFGNIVVACADGGLWRVCPEELSAKKIRDDANVSAALLDEAFQEDWLFENVAAAAHDALGPLSGGQCYAFKIWPIMGGAFTADNMYLAVMTEWLAVSGDVGKQIKDLPSGTKITLDVVGDGEVRASVETEQAGASALSTYPSVESGVRDLMGLLASPNYQELEGFTRGAGLSAADVARAIQEHGKTVVPCPEPIEDVLDILEVTGKIRPTWSVVVPVYTREEGRSDLSVELTIVELGGERYGIAIDDIRVR
jgi:hypothetical protein